MGTKQKRRGRAGAIWCFNRFSRDHSVDRSRIKGIIVWLAVRGFLPMRLADWIIQHGGMRDA